MDDRCDTQRRVLESACRLFAEKGYAGTTVADICERAGANKAAVNYHFRSKENLYAEAWRLAFRGSMEAHPVDGGVPSNAPAEERLRGHILSTIRRITDPNSYEFDIVEKERAQPTGLLAEVMRDSIEPVRLQVAGIVRELLGSGASEEQVMLCHRSIMAQCMHFFLRERPGRKAFFPPPNRLPVEAVAEHIVRFSLAGIRNMRQSIERGEAPSEEPPSRE